ncbi:hypothetical protein SAMN04488038_109205 [Solimonas aquatica]|uniref:Uncharacterized protein n=1 Tax=Solimonas aquatica TaxID=489703 RepID=A0A1H9I6X2_9GAMM|nr:hypothetical protein [Solimonas aquatica]SEQ70282.1 hypothetical protein SAMN04488038_109205 [Solimonas aquatica]
MKKALIATAMAMFCGSAFAGPLALLGITGGHSADNTTTLNINTLSAVADLTGGLADSLNQQAAAQQRSSLLGTVLGQTSELTTKLQQSLKLDLNHSGSSDLTIGATSWHSSSQWSFNGTDGFSSSFQRTSSSSF